jgi:nicotinate-nucleotide adenylyltransferase
MVKSDPVDTLTQWGDRRRRKVGLLGGSFNPAHDGHLHVALAALSRLHLDQVWFLVSPQNPLKQTKGMAPFKDRLASVKDVQGRHPRLFATGIEAGLGTRYSVDTVTKLKQRFPLTQFVWLMGADNLFQISRWNRWIRLFYLVPIAIIDRPPYSHAVLAAKAATRFASSRRSNRALLDRGLPAWTFLHIRRHPASASEIRAVSNSHLTP